MNGNFDIFSTIDSDTAELTPFWAEAEKAYIQEILNWWYATISANDYTWEVRFAELSADIRTAETILAGYGIKPNVGMFE